MRILVTVWGKRGVNSWLESNSVSFGNGKKEGVYCLKARSPKVVVECEDSLSDFQTTNKISNQTGIRAF